MFTRGLAKGAVVRDVSQFFAQFGEILECEVNTVVLSGYVITAGRFPSLPALFLTAAY